MGKQFDHDELLKLTSKEFADYVQERINSQQEIREVMAYRVRIDRHGVTEEEVKENPEDAPIVVVDYLSGWQGKPHALWTYWFDTHTKNFDHSVVNKDTIDRFHALEEGADELPELGLYSFPAENDPGYWHLNNGQIAILKMFPDAARLYEKKIEEGYRLIDFKYDAKVSTGGEESLEVKFVKDSVQYQMNQGKGPYAGGFSHLVFGEVGQRGEVVRFDDEVSS